MPEQVYDNIYLIKLPLPGNPLKNLNSYLIKGQKRSLLVDTGFNHPETEKALRDGLAELGINLEDLDIFLTHAHSDHSGLAGKLKNSANQVFSSTTDGELLQKYGAGDAYWLRLIKNQVILGFPYKLSHKDHPGYHHKNNIAYQRVHKDPGDILQAGDYTFEIMDLGGHTQGQIGLYEREHKLLFSGDHLLRKITPNLKFWGFDYDTLGTYLANMEKLRTVEIEHLFSAHRELITDIGERIDQMMEHHRVRLDWALKQIALRPSNAWDVAAVIKWDFSGGDFLTFPPPQQWFAANEALVHLEYLFRHRTDVKREFKTDGAVYYSLKG